MSGFVHLKFQVNTLCPYVLPTLTFIQKSYDLFLLPYYVDIFGDKMVIDTKYCMTKIKKGVFSYFSH